MKVIANVTLVHQGKIVAIGKEVDLPEEYVERLGDKVKPVGKVAKTESSNESDTIPEVKATETVVEKPKRTRKKKAE